VEQPVSDLALELVPSGIDVIDHQLSRGVRVA
jgi:hypothetical protein